MKFFYGLIFFLFVSISAYSQITANPMTGCAPLVGVQFTSPPTATNINWDFGDGSGSALPNPSHTFTTPGNYKIIFTGSISGNPYSDSVTVVVFGNPTTNFSATTARSGCLLLTVSFADSSIGGGGTNIVKWEWSFGDGGINLFNSANQTYIYTLPGRFDVSLKVTDENGCNSSLLLKNYISLSIKPRAIITSVPDTLIACNPPLIIDFNGSGSYTNSTTDTTLTYFWDFANGNTSTVKNPTAQTYNSYGYDTVKLIVTDDNNCPDTARVAVTINSPLASFKAKGAVKDTVCSLVTFTNNSTPGNYFFDYGDGTTGTDSVHQYPPGPGTYFVKLTVTDGNNCTDDSTIKIIIERIHASATASPTFGCSSPYTVNYTDQSTNAVSWKWYFFTGDSSSAKNPTKQYWDTGHYNIYYIYDTIFDSTRLVVTSPHGCKDDTILDRHDTLLHPTALFMPDKQHGCAPLTVTFTDLTITLNKVTNWKWHFGDGTVNNGGNSTVSHTYNTAGEYYAYLVITTAMGCKDSSFPILIEVGDPPNTNFTVSKTQVCPLENVTFTDLTPAADSAETWHYISDGIQLSHCYTQSNPSWGYFSDTGKMDVTLINGYNGCKNSLVKNDYITVLGPIARIKFTSDCNSPLVYNFTVDAKGADDWDWDFGDGTVINNSTATTISYTYSATGDFTAKITARNNSSGCSPFVDNILVKVRNLKAIWTADTLTCLGTPISFMANSSQDVFEYCHTGYYLDKGDGSCPKRNSVGDFTYTYPDSGDYTAMMIVRDENMCTDTAFLNTTVSYLSAYFGSNKTTGCSPLAVNFRDSSFSNTIIIKWNWDFGDGGNASTKNASHTYTTNDSTIYTINLIVTDTVGCSKSTQKQIKVSKPAADFIQSLDTSLCPKDTVFFDGLGSNYTYTWFFGSGDSSKIQSPFYVYKNAGFYDVTLVVKDAIGCRDTLKKDSLVIVQALPMAIIASNVDSLNVICAPILINFTDTSLIQGFAFRKWEVEPMGQVVSLKTVGRVYDSAATYKVKLYVESSFGCADSVSRNFRVRFPKADFNLIPDIICKGDDITFTIKDTVDVLTYAWDFGDGNDTSAVSPVSHPYNFNPLKGTTNATLIYWSDDSTCATTVTKPINIRPVVADFKRNNDSIMSDTIHCFGSTDMIYNISTNNDTWSWDLGDTIINGKDSIAHLYQPGQYTIMLSIINNATGCRDTIRKPMLIHPLPIPTATGGEICFGDTLQIFSSGGAVYSWSPQDGLTNSNIPSPFSSPDASTIYTVVVTDTNSCQNSDTAIVTVFPKPPEIIWDTAIIIGEKVTLNANACCNFIYTWNPTDSLSCADCSITTSHTLTDITYTVNIADTVGCFDLPSVYKIIVLPKTTIDVPNVFTPNGDGINDRIYVRGWGIKRLIEFKIFNRWGQLVYESSDIVEGWDGFLKGELQDDDTYVYTATVETWIEGQSLSKNGSFTLIK